jgi:hypothetical protein
MIDNTRSDIPSRGIVSDCLLPAVLPPPLVRPRAAPFPCCSVLSVSAARRLLLLLGWPRLTGLHFWPSRSSVWAAAAVCCFGIVVQPPCVHLVQLACGR